MQYEENYDESLDVTQENESTGHLTEEVEVKPVNFGKKKVGVIIEIAIAIVLIVTLLMCGVSWVKETSSPTKSSDAVKSSQSTSIEVSSKEVEKEAKNSEISSSSEEVSSSSPKEEQHSETLKATESEKPKEDVDIKDLLKQQASESSNNENTVSNTESQSTSVSTEETIDFMVVQTEPALGAEIQTSGIVKGKSMYKVGTSYTYGVNIIIITGNDTNVECCYFCPRKTYSALAIGDTLSVTYQMDSMGNVSVSTISKQ